MVFFLLLLFLSRTLDVVMNSAEPLFLSTWHDEGAGTTSGKLSTGGDTQSHIACRK